MASCAICEYSVAADALIVSAILENSKELIVNVKWYNGKSFAFNASLVIPINLPRCFYGGRKRNWEYEVTEAINKAWNYAKSDEKNSLCLYYISLEDLQKIRWNSCISTRPFTRNERFFYDYLRTRKLIVEEELLHFGHRLIFVVLIMVISNSMSKEEKKVKKIVTLEPLLHLRDDFPLFTSRAITRPICYKKIFSHRNTALFPSQPGSSVASVNERRQP